LKAEIERIYGLDKPLWEQYLLWLRQVLAGNLGVSLVTGRPIAANWRRSAQFVQDHLDRRRGGLLPGTLFGVLAAVYNGRWQDKAFSLISITGVSVPPFWFGILLVALFSFELNWLPAQGMGPEGFPLTWEQWRHMILPIATLALIRWGWLAGGARSDPGGAFPGIRRRLGGQGADAGVDPRPRGAQHRSNRPGGDGAAVRLPDRRLNPGGDGVQLAGHRKAPEPGDLLPATSR